MYLLTLKQPEALRNSSMEWSHLYLIGFMWKDRPMDESDPSGGVILWDDISTEGCFYPNVTCAPAVNTA
jgi:hypothetical protein